MKTLVLVEIYTSRFQAFIACMKRTSTIKILQKKICLNNFAVIYGVFTVIIQAQVSTEDARQTNLIICNDKIRFEQCNAVISVYLATISIVSISLSPSISLLSLSSSTFIISTFVDIIVYHIVDVSLIILEK